MIQGFTRYVAEFLQGLGTNAMWVWPERPAGEAGKRFGKDGARRARHRGDRASLPGNPQGLGTPEAAGCAASVRPRRANDFNIMTRDEILEAFNNLSMVATAVLAGIVA